MLAVVIGKSIAFIFFIENTKVKGGGGGGGGFRPITLEKMISS